MFVSQRGSFSTVVRGYCHTVACNKNGQSKCSNFFCAIFVLFITVRQCFFANELNKPIAFVLIPFSMFTYVCL